MGWRLAWWGSTEDASHLLGLKGRHQYSHQRSNRIRTPCEASTAVGTEEEGTKWPDCQRREQLTGDGREAGRSLMEREKNTGPRTDPCRTPRRTRKGRLLINHASAPITKERSSSTSKARREASRNEFVEKSGMPDGVKSFRKINSTNDCSRARSGFVKPTRNELRKEHNLI